ncbi:hypothetical protein GW17_00042555 [Ensete ventricosum]|nr:hypothetical protein GW17_00042555 [Ensete ventricosum]
MRGSHTPIISKPFGGRAAAVDGNPKMGNIIPLLQTRTKPSPLASSPFDPSFSHFFSAAFCKRMHARLLKLNFGNRGVCSHAEANNELEK